jgi:uncharacterized protein (DUF58 family)
MIKQAAQDNSMNLNSDPTRVDLHELISLSRFAQHFQLPKIAIKSQYKGSMLSAFKGRGMELADIRRYEDGDDVRDINWMALARTGELHTNLYQEERERPLFLWVDQSHSMQFATQGLYKAVIASKLAALVGWHELQNHNRVGGFAVNDTKVSHFNAARSRKGFVQLLEQLTRNQQLSTSTEKPLTFYQKLQGLSQMKLPGVALYIFSDFRGWDEDCKKLLLRLSKHQDILLTMILDPIELHFPEKGYYALSNGKKQININTADKKVLAKYYETVSTRVNDVMEMAKYPGIDCSQVLTTDKPIIATYRALNEHREEFKVGDK